MKIEEYGKHNYKTIIMLHGANFVHTFGRQYPLSSKYHIIVPHLMGFGDNADRVFQTDECVNELANFIKSLDKKVMLVAFSLGAQLAFKLVSEYEELFESAVIVSPCLIKDESLLSKMAKINIKQLNSMKNKFFCNLIGIMNGLPKAPRKEFVLQMQNVKEETIRNIVYNGITLESVPSFAKVSIPVMAVAGAKEQDEIINSVKQMSKNNPNCKYEIWEKANHNIPPVFAKRLNNLISSMF